VFRFVNKHMMFWEFYILLLLVLIGPVSCTANSSATFLVISLTVVITGFLILLMIIYALLVMQRR